MKKFFKVVGTIMKWYLFLDMALFAYIGIKTVRPYLGNNTMRKDYDEIFKRFIPGFYNWYHE